MPSWQGWTVVASYFVKLAKLGQKYPRILAPVSLCVKVLNKKNVCESRSWRRGRVYAGKTGEGESGSPVAHVHGVWSAGSLCCGDCSSSFHRNLTSLASPNPGPNPSCQIISPARGGGAHGEVHQLPLLRSPTSLNLEFLRDGPGFHFVPGLLAYPWRSHFSCFTSIFFSSFPCYKLQTHHPMQKQQPYLKGPTIAGSQITVINSLSLITHDGSISLIK